MFNCLILISGDHTACLWQVAEGRLVQVRSFLGHTRSVRTLAYRKNDLSCFASGARDNSILIWDIRSRQVGSIPKADNCIYSGHAGGPGTPAPHKKRTRQTPNRQQTVTNSSITGLVFQDDHTLVSCGGGDGIIKVWDLRRNYSCYKREPLPKHSIPYPGVSSLKGYTNVITDSTGQRLYVSCMDHHIYCYNIGVYATQPLMVYTGVRIASYFIKTCLSPDDQYLMSGCSDPHAIVWNVNQSQPMLKLESHDKEVTCVAWADSTSDTRIVTCSDDSYHKIWRINYSNFEDQDVLLEYKGQARICERTIINVPLKSRLKALENTPKTLRRLVQRNETTPSSTEKIILKRTYSELCTGDQQGTNSLGGGDAKRQLMETRARRLFSPSTSTSIDVPDSREFGFHRILPDISEEVVAESVTSPQTPNSDTDQSEKFVSPLNERSNIKHFEARTPSSSLPRPSTSAIFFSPTSNLPNYVLDGDAPHLKLQSPKRKLKENVDWLTNIRKQRMLSSANGRLSDKLNIRSTQHDINASPSMPSPSSSNQHDIQSAGILSPRMQKLKSLTNSYGSSPRRRMSSCSPHPHPVIEETKTTPSRRNSEATILRFFSVASPSAPKTPVASTSSN